jgi:general secretion pathway protein B
MSYILEALKKAQAERAHGAVPGVDAQPVPTIAARAPIPMGAWMIVVLVLLVASVVLYWQGPWGRPGRETPSAVTQAPATIDVPAPAADTAKGPGATAPADTASKPAPASPPAPSPAAEPAPAKPMRKLGERMPGELAASVPSPAPTPAPERIALLQELPPQIQREIPALAINGYIYASNPADRSVLINNRLRREGDTLGEGFVLEKLLPREMVLNYRGYRYRISY